MKHITLFDTTTLYNNATLDLPNVSLTLDDRLIHYNPIIDYSKLYLTCVALEDGTISFNIWKNMGTDMITSISYSTDNGSTWTTTNNINNKASNLQITVNVSEGDKILWKGNAQQLGFYDEDEEYDDNVGSFFSSDCEFDAMGNVMSMLYGDNFVGETTLEEDGAFAYLFSDFDENYSCGVVDASNLVLPVMTLATHSYYGMFAYCASLTNAPQLPATTLANHCYGAMFYGCTSLTNAPQLPATTLAIDCYGAMFRNCTSLTSAPQLLATTLREACYSYMFNGCTNLTTAPELPATTLATDCYNSMFSGCTSLNYIKAMFTTTPNTIYTKYWVSGVAATGTFVKNSAAQWNVTDVNGIPTNWTVENQAI